jgi:hypothetical protein
MGRKLEHEIHEMNPVLLCLLLYSPFLMVDVISCFLNTRRTLRGKGASGLPLVTVMLFASALVVVRLPSVDVEIKLLAALLAALIHFTLVFGVPRLCRTLAKDVHPAR